MAHIYHGVISFNPGHVLLVVNVSSLPVGLMDDDMIGCVLIARH